MRIQYFLIIALISTQFGIAFARDFDAERLERRAYEAALWGQALVAGNEMIGGGIAAGQKLNQVAFFSRPPNWKFQQPTPNNSTCYVQLTYDVKQGPVVVELPPTKGPYSIFGTFLDVWQRPVVDVGAGGDDKGKGGKYFLYNARDPKITVPDGYLPVPLQTYRGYGTLRVITPDLEPKTLEGAVEYIKAGFQQYPHGNSDRHPRMDIYDKEYSSLFPWDHTFFQRLQEVINHEEVREEDKYVMGMLSSIGIDRGGSFEPDKETRAVLDRVMKRVHGELQYRLRTILPPRWGDKSQWTQPVPESMISTMMTYKDENKVYIDDRAFTYYTYISPPVKLGLSTAYLMLTKDADGEPLKGDRNYTLTVPANVPAKQFWSVVVYDVATASYIREADPIGLASTENPKQNSDDTFTLHFGPKPLNGGVNYLPTGNAANYFLLFRFYGPEKAYNDNSWMLNDMEKQR
ncbi:MAG: DUF1214 domain-containing protein [Candidatus Jettenia sp.]|nr:MAG: DUF1214 domain-containing protein [Candidatus Jettenia sp.]